MTAYYLDATVPAYALGGEHPARDPARRLIREAAEGRIVLQASVEMVQELLHHRMRRVDAAVAVRQARAVGEMCILHSFDTATLSRALDLVAEAGVRGRDAVHAATALMHGVPQVLSTDPDFDRIPGITRVPPSAFD